MSEWWQYRAADLLMFSRATYERLFGQVNADAGPLLLATAVAAALVLVLVVTRQTSARTALWLLAVAWATAGWAFHWRQYAQVHLAGPAFGVAFGVQALALAVAGAAVTRRAHTGPTSQAAAALGLLLAAVAGWPLLGVALGRPWPQVELAGLAPDPTALATLALLPWLHRALPAPLAWALWVLPLTWCAFSVMTLATLGSALAPWLAVAALGPVAQHVVNRVRARQRV